MPLGCFAEARVLRIVQQIGRVCIPNASAGGKRTFEHRDRFARRARCEDRHVQARRCRSVHRPVNRQVVDPANDDAADSVPESQRQADKEDRIRNVGPPEPPVGEPDDRYQPCRGQRKQDQTIDEAYFRCRSVAPALHPPVVGRGERSHRFRASPRSSGMNR